MAIKKKRRVSIRIDMTPMVDIAFLLLIFYMVTTSFKPPEAHSVELPESHSQIELPDKDIINLTVTKDDSIYVDYVTVREITVDGITETVQGRYVVHCRNVADIGNEIQRVRLGNRGAKVNSLVVVKADRAARFGLMREVTKVMQANDLERFLIITDVEKDKVEVPEEKEPDEIG